MLGGMASSRLVGVVCLLFATCSWGGLFVFGKRSLDYLDPYWFTAVRYLSSALIFATILAFGRGGLGKVKGVWFRLFFLGVFGYGVFGTMVFVGLKYTDPSHGAVIMATIPLTALIFSWAVDSVRPRWWELVASAVAFLGVSLVSGVFINPWSGSVKGDLIALLGTLGWVIYTRGQKRLMEFTVVEYTGLTTILSAPGLFGAVVIATLLGFAELPSLDKLLSVAPSMLYVVVVATVLAVICYNKGVRILGPGNGVAFINMVPVSALFIGALVGDVPTFDELFGTVLVVFGLSLLSYGMSLKK